MCIRKTTPELARKFSAHARKYMVVYKQFADDPDSPDINYDLIEKAVKATYCHRNAADFAFGYIARVYREVCGIEDSSE